MGKKKHLKGIDEYDRELIEEAMKKKTSYCNDFVNYNFTVKFKCKTQAQKEFVKLLKNPDKHIVVGAGSAGTGKSFITLATALQMLGKSYNEGGDVIKQIIIVVPTVPAGGADQVTGLLPGELDSKIAPFRAADEDTIEKILNESGVINAKSLANGLTRNNVIKHEVVSYVRGKTWDNAIILLNEAEDYSFSELYSLITRIGQNSKLWITGDLRQCDRKYIKKSEHKNGGLGYMMTRFKYLEEYGCVEFKPEDIVRNGLITKMIQLWDMPEDEFNALENSYNKNKSTEDIEEQVTETISDEPIVEEKPKKRGRPKKITE